MIIAALILIGFAALTAPPAVLFVGWALWRAWRDGFPAPRPQPLIRQAQVRVIRGALTGGRRD